MTDNTLEAWFKTAPQGQQATLAWLRCLITSLDPGVQEEFKWQRPCYLGRRGLFCYLQSTKNHVSLGFQNGALLDDPHGLLHGTGKDMRHVKLGPGSEPDGDALRDLLRQAWRNVS